MIITFVPAAKEEFLDAIRRYEEARSGLGERFKEEADRCIRWIAGILTFTERVRRDIGGSIFVLFPITYRSS